MAERTRKAINVLLPNRLYQRGKVLTWTLEDKRRLLQERKITAAINFWPKLDPDWGNLPLDWYWHVPAVSAGMTATRILVTANAVAAYLQQVPNSAVLVLCEAGKTRSVFFSILVMKLLLSCPYMEAKRCVLAEVPGAQLKPDMMEWLLGQPN